MTGRTARPSQALPEDRVANRTVRADEGEAKARAFLAAQHGSINSIISAC